MSKWLIILALASAPHPSSDEAKLDRDYDAVQKLTQTGRWGQAGRALKKLLVAHESADYLKPRVAEMVDLYRRCSFFEEHPAFAAEETIHGELTEWNPRTNQLSVTYTELNEDFAANGDTLRIHPAEFIGPYRVEAVGRLQATPKNEDISNASPQILVCAYGGESVQVAFGLPSFSIDSRTLSIPPRIYFNSRGSGQALGETPNSPLKFDSEYTIAIEVDSKTITTFAAGRQVQQVANPTGTLGRIGIIDLPGLTRLTISGEASSSWLNSQQDSARQNSWAQFAAQWKVADELPIGIAKLFASARAEQSQQHNSFNNESVSTRSQLGPVWEHAFEYKSRHYTVRSDIDRQTCFDAAQVLEAALRFYQFRLGRLSFESNLESTYHVYIFSGPAGYNRYAGDQFGSAPENTAGLYSPSLKQLLVWNPTEQEHLATTLRHEGLHQFLDATLGRLPPWFNEGMAEYFESAQPNQATPADETAHREHLALLLNPSFDWIPYGELFAFSADKFYQQPAAKYAQSWALIHWLLNSDIANTRIFSSAFTDLSRGTDSREIAQRLLALGDLEALVRAHLQKIEY